MSNLSSKVKNEKSKWSLDNEYLVFGFMKRLQFKIRMPNDIIQLCLLFYEDLNRWDEDNIYKDMIIDEQNITVERSKDDAADYRHAFGIESISNGQIKEWKIKLFTKQTSQTDSKPEVTFGIVETKYTDYNKYHMSWFWTEEYKGYGLWAENGYLYHASSSDTPNHLIVIQHGLNYPAIFNYATFYYIKQSLSNKQECNHDEYLLYIADSNSSPYLLSFLYHTNNGIHHGSTNLANEIYQIIEENPFINKISLLGGSLGGNYIRYASYLLHSDFDTYHVNNKPFFDAIKPTNLITLAAPHYGINDWIKIPQIFIPYLKYFPSLTMRELLQIDEDEILSIMNEQGSDHLKTLSLFDKVLIYYNSGFDSMVECESASFDMNGTHCQFSNDYCNQHGNDVFQFDNDSLFSMSSDFYRIPVCLKRNLFEMMMSHLIVSLAMPPVSANVVELLLK